VDEENWVELPPHVGDPLEVYVNGILQEYGVDYEQVGRELMFHRPLVQEGKLGLLRWASMFLGVAGTYRKHQTIDVIYESEGRRLVETGLKPRSA
jgi:hypothetical protein